jgi:hypothetical protein
MAFVSKISPGWEQIVVVLSLLLLFFTVPHTLEDFATGEPAKAGVPAPVLSFVISLIVSMQALGLFWIGQGLRRGLFVHVGVGLFWPVASGIAQIPTILDADVYRAGVISIVYVAGMIVVGVLLCLASLWALRVNPTIGRTGPM